MSGNQQKNCDFDLKAPIGNFQRCLASSTCWLSLPNVFLVNGFDGVRESSSSQHSLKSAGHFRIGTVTAAQALTVLITSPLRAPRCASDGAQGK